MNNDNNDEILIGEDNIEDKRPNLQPQNNLVFTQTNTENLQQPVQPSIDNNTQENSLNRGLADVDPMQIPKEEPKKIGKKALMIMLFIVLVILSLVGYIVYDRYFKINPTDKKDKTPKTVKKVTKEDMEYISFDSKQYLKLNKDNTYELKVSVEGKETESNGKYIKENNTYKLNDNIKVNYNNDYVEITSIKVDNYVFYNFILFNKKNISQIKKVIDTNITNNINTIKKEYTTAPDLEKIETQIDSCFKYALTEEDKKTDIAQNITCSINYKIYTKNYNYDECNNTDTYIAYMIPSGECSEGHIISSKYFLLDPSNNYNIIGTFTGL